MKAKTRLTAGNIYEGMRVKLRLPRLWCGFGDKDKQFIWLTGIVKRVKWSELITAGPEAGHLSRCACIIDCRHRHGNTTYKMKNLVCTADMTNTFRSMYKLKRDSL